ncbi:MAG: DUF4352 domain-containing protein [Eubacterium sp.]|nr:DUF4352 domain-containing protein [Eubacterium sp.]
MKRIALVFCILTVFIAGCGTPVITLTEDERSTIVTYASGVLLKYNRAADKGLTSATLSEEEETTEEKSAEETATDEEETTDASSESSEETSYAPDSDAVAIEEVLELNGLDIEYDSISYMQTFSEGDYFDMSAASGNTYQVLTIKLTNNTSSKISVDILNQNPTLTYEINGESYKAMTTVLSEDFHNMQTSVAAGKSKTAVLITEVSEDDSIDAESIILYATVNGTKGCVTLL